MTAMTDPDDQDANHGTPDIGNHPIIANAIFPKFTKFRAFESLTDSARVVLLR
jgi:hypothetical protein